MKPRIRIFKSQISNLKPRRGFTLVEVLVVIAIIGMLVGLLLPAIMSAVKNAKTMIVKTDMTELANALENFKTGIGGGQYPPDHTYNPDNSINTDLQQFCKVAWPRVTWVLPGQANYSVTPPKVPYPVITPDTALCFWLGGAQDASNTFIGFSANPTNPFDFGQSRTPTVLEFQKSRLKLSTSASVAVADPNKAVFYNLNQYYPPNGKDLTSGTYSPYVYFKPVAGQYGLVASNNITYTYWVQPIDSSKITPYKDSTSFVPPPYNPNTKAYPWTNPTTYQLLCPGMDGKYGKAPANGNGPLGNDPPDAKSLYAPLYSAGTNYDAISGIDDMANFTKGATVGNDAQ